jgi:hypothetical protein
MEGRRRARAIYLGTALAIVGVISGMAAASLLITFSPTATQGQNGYSVTTGPTIWAFNSATASATLATPCSTSPQAITIVTPGVSPAAKNVQIASAGAGTCALTDLSEQFAFTGTVVSTPTSDVFTVFSTTSASSSCAVTTAQVNSITITTSGGSATATTVTLNLYVDFGATATLPNICSIQIAVSGT